MYRTLIRSVCALRLLGMGAIAGTDAELRKRIDKRRAFESLRREIHL
jgi:hypothetical protein